MCDTAHTNHGDLPVAFGIAGAFFLGLLAIIKAAWWLTVHVLAPLVAVLAVAAYRWTSGAPMLPDRPTATAPLFTRPVRATARNLLTLLLAGTIIAPVATAIVGVTVVSAAVATVVAVRVRAARRRRPRRVQVIAGVPVRGPRMARDLGQPAITDVRSDLTWTEQSARDAAGRAAR